LSNQVKYLGVFLDSKLNWRVHVDAKYKKTLAVAGKTWGTTPKVTHWIYTAVLCYAAVIWWTRTLYITVSKQLEHLQRLACLYVIGAKRLTPMAALKIVTGIVPLSVYMEKEAMSACFRLKLKIPRSNISWLHTYLSPNNGLIVLLWSCVWQELHDFCTRQKRLAIQWRHPKRWRRLLYRRLKVRSLRPGWCWSFLFRLMGTNWYFP